MHKKALLSWLLKNIFLPLLPVLIAGLLRAIQNMGSLSGTLFESSDVFFSMAMLCLLAYTDLQQISDTDTREILTNIFVGLMVLMLALFAQSVIADTDLENVRTAFVEVLNKLIGTQTTLDENLLKVRLSTHDELEIRKQTLAWVSYCVAGVVIFVTILTKWKFGPWEHKNRP